MQPCTWFCLKLKFLLVKLYCRHRLIDMKRYNMYIWDIKCMWYTAKSSGSIYRRIRYGLPYTVVLRIWKYIVWLKNTSVWRSTSRFRKSESLTYGGNIIFWRSRIPWIEYSELSNLCWEFSYLISITSSVEYKLRRPRLKLTPL